MPDHDRYETLRERAKDVRRQAKATLRLLNALEGVQASLDRLADDEEFDEVNLEIAADGEVLFEIDVGELESLREPLQAMLTTLQGQLEEALARAEQELA